MTGDGQLDAEQLRALFQELSDRLEERGQQAQLFVVGGAAMALEYDGKRVTRDVDAAFAPTLVVRQIAAELGNLHGLEADWINDAAKGFLPGQDEEARTVFDSESLLVQVASPQYLLAMKLHAARGERDLSDAATLYNVAGYTTAEEGAALLSRTYPVAQLLPRHRYIVDDVAHRASEQRALHDSSARELDRADEDLVGPLRELNTRAAPGDFVAIDRIRNAGVYPDAQLLEVAHARIPGFDSAGFTRQLDRAAHLTADQVAEHGLNDTQLEGMQARFDTWSQAIRRSHVQKDESRRGMSL